MWLVLFSSLYRLCRFLLSRLVFFYQLAFKKSPDFEPVITIGHLGLRAINRLIPSVFTYPIPQGIATTLYDLTFPSPLILAAFEGDQRIVSIWSQFGLGGTTFKTVLPHPHLGNARPRIQSIVYQGSPCLINAMGLPSKGLAAFLQSLHCYTPHPEKPIGLSIGGHCVEEYLHVFSSIYEFVSHHPVWKNQPVFFEYNISCPNTPHHESIGKNPALITDLLTKTRSLTSNAIISVKLSPDHSDDTLLELADRIGQHPLTALTLGNTHYHTCSSVGLPDHTLSIGGGGLSGPPLLSRTLDMIDLLAPFGLPIIATGGIHTGPQALLARQKGATLIGLATAVVQDPYVIARINRYLASIK